MDFPAFPIMNFLNKAILIDKNMNMRNMKHGTTTVFSSVI